MKKRVTKRFVSTFMALLLALSMLAVNVYADTEGAVQDPAAAVEAQDDVLIENAAGEDGPEAPAADTEAPAADPESPAADVQADPELEAAEEKPEDMPAATADPEFEAAEEETEKMPAAAVDVVEGKVLIAMDSCTKIGEEEAFEADIYYINIGNAGTTVQLTDFADKTDGLTITGVGSTGYVSDTNVVNLKDGFGTTWNFFEEQYGKDLDAAACAGLDFSNICAMFVMTSDMDYYFFVIQGPSMDFQWSVGQFLGVEENAAVYYDYTDYPDVKEKYTDLYKIAVPAGTESVELTFTEERLAYAYESDGSSFIASCGAEGDGSYANNGATGQLKAVVKAKADGTMPARVFVQTPYVENSSTTLFAISFVTYGFDAFYNGKKLTNITFEPGAYEYFDYMAQANQYAGLFKIVIPKGAESIDFEVEGPVLHYNYVGGEFSGGWVTDPTNGDTRFSATVDLDGFVAKDGAPDDIQFQIPYDANYNSLLLYAVTFEYEQSADPGQTIEDVSADVTAIFENVCAALDALMQTEEAQTFGSEWQVLDLARAGYLVPDEYFQAVCNYLIEHNGVLHTNKYNYTNYARLILALTASGINPTDAAHYDLTAALADYDAITAQGINGPMWALIALDSYDYPIPAAAEGVTQATRDNLVAAILAGQHEDGGWAYGESEPSDPDLTGIAIQALAPYYQLDGEVKSAVDKAVKLLSAMQTEDGLFKSLDAQGDPTCESSAMVVIALASLGINPDTNENFIKNGISALDGLCSFWVDGGFKHVANGDINVMATDQGFRALVAYLRLVGGQTSLYDMTDLPALSVMSYPVDPFDYEGDTLNAIKEDGSGFGMFTPQEGTKAVLQGNNVVITYYTKNTTVYKGFYFNSDIHYTPSWETLFEMNADKYYQFSVSADYCGKAIPIVPIKFKDPSATTADQYYLAIPAKDKLERIPAEEFVFDGDAVNFIKEDGAGFGMYGPQEGTLASVKGDKIQVKYYPKNKTIYKGFYLGADITDKETWTVFIPADEEGNFSFELPQEYAGKAWPVAPVKKSDETATTAAQYYLAVPEMSKLGADYTVVDEAIESVPNLLLYTPESAKAVQAVIDAIDYTLLYEDQAAVDLMAGTINYVVTQLVPAATVTVNITNNVSEMTGVRLIVSTMIGESTPVFLSNGDNNVALGYKIYGAVVNDGEKILKLTASNADDKSVIEESVIFPGGAGGFSFEGLELTKDMNIVLEAVDAKVSKVTLKDSKKTSYTYTGKAIKPEVIVTANVGGGQVVLEEGKDYTLKYTNNTNVGTATITANGKGAYTGSAKVTFKITAAKVTPTVTLSKTSYVYDGKVKTPTVTVKAKVGGTTKTLKKDKDYKVTYASGRKTPGKYSVKVTLKGNYSGSKTVYFKIVPKGTKITSLTVSGKGQITVKWAAQKTQTTGYQIEYSTSSSFKTSTKVGVGSNKTVSKVIKNLKKNKTYYFRIRTYKKVGSSYYYSAWSAAKSKKVTK